MFAVRRYTRPEEIKPSVEPKGHIQRRRPKIGLALGAGVARGWTHIGIIRGL